MTSAIAVYYSNHYIIRGTLKWGHIKSFIILSKKKKMIVIISCKTTDNVYFSTNIIHTGPYMYEYVVMYGNTDSNRKFKKTNIVKCFVFLDDNMVIVTGDSTISTCISMATTFVPLSVDMNMYLYGQECRQSFHT